MIKKTCPNLLCYRARDFLPPFATTAVLVRYRRGIVASLPPAVSLFAATSPCLCAASSPLTPYRKFYLLLPLLSCRKHWLFATAASVSKLLLLHCCRLRCYRSSLLLLPSLGFCPSLLSRSLIPQYLVVAAAFHVSSPTSPLKTLGVSCCHHKQPASTGSLAKIWRGNFLHEKNIFANLFVFIWV